MLSPDANLNVVLFFLLGSGIFAFLGFKFYALKVNPFKDFGIGLSLFGLSFLGFAAVVATHPAELGLMMSLSVLPFVAGFIALVSSATFNWQKNTRTLMMTIAIAFLVTLFALRTWVYPSSPGFSENGLVSFNAQPPVLILYILAFAGGLMTAIQVVTTRITLWRQAALTRIFFNLIVLGGVILLTSADDQMQYLNSALLTTGFLGLFVLYVRSKVSIDAKA